MYSVKISDNTISDLISAAKTCPSIIDKIALLEENPLARATAMDIKEFGTHYIRAGRYCLVLEIDEDHKLVWVIG